MAKNIRGPRMHVLSEERTDQVIFDERGEPELRFGETVREGEHNGREIAETVTDHIETSAGGVLIASSLMPGPHQVRVGICAVCKRQTRPSLFRRGRPKITLAPAAGMKRCRRCRANLCEQHFRISDFDRRARCDRCYRWHWFYNGVVKRILFLGGGR